MRESADISEVVGLNSARLCSTRRRRLLTCAGDVWNGGTRVAVARLPAGSRRNSRQGCLRYKSARPPRGLRSPRPSVSGSFSSLPKSWPRFAGNRRSPISWLLENSNTISPILTRYSGIAAFPGRLTIETWNRILPQHRFCAGLCLPANN
jgi:hypothetical protein